MQARQRRFRSFSAAGRELIQLVVSLIAAALRLCASTVRDEFQRSEAREMARGSRDRRVEEFVFFNVFYEDGSNP
jgi:hypothetical protein